MLIDTLPGLLENTAPLPPGPFDTALDFCRNAGPRLTAGRHDIDGNTVYALVSEYDSRADKIDRLEAHHRYADIQMILSGAEALGYAPVTPDLPLLEAYDLHKDVCFYGLPKTGLSHVQLHPDRAAVLWPRDAHLPGIALTQGPVPVKKLVVKVLVETT